MSSIALLAPVPWIHLEDGEDTCRSEGMVAFGSRAWELFQELDALRNGTKVPAYIYASHGADAQALAVTWAGQYVGRVSSEHGKHPDPRLRPPSTHEEDEVFDLNTSWTLFWHVQDLHRLAEEDRIPLHEFAVHGKSKPYKKGFVPEGPLIVDPPA